MEAIPLTSTDFVEGIPRKLYILGNEDRKALGTLVEKIDSVPEKEWRAWDDDTKMYYSSLAHKADTVFTQCVVVPQVFSVLQKISSKNVMKTKEDKSVLEQIKNFKANTPIPKNKPIDVIER